MAIPRNEAILNVYGSTYRALDGTTFKVQHDGATSEFAGTYDNVATTFINKFSPYYMEFYRNSIGTAYGLRITPRDLEYTSVNNHGWGGTNCSTSLNTRLSNAHIVLLSSSNPLKPTAVNTWATRDVPELKKYARAYVNVIIGDALNTYLPVFKYSGASTYSANAFGTSTYYAVMKYVVDFVNGKVGVYCNNIAGWNVANHIMVSSIIASENDKL